MLLITSTPVYPLSVCILLSIPWPSIKLTIPGTFYGGTRGIDWNKDYRKKLIDKGITTYFVPCFSDDPTAGSDPGGLYQKYPTVHGLFSWETGNVDKISARSYMSNLILAWPQEWEGKKSVSSTADTQMAVAAKSAKKTFMMG